MHIFAHWLRGRKVSIESFSCRRAPFCKASCALCCHWWHGDYLLTAQVIVILGMEQHVGVFAARDFSPRERASITHGQAVVGRRIGETFVIAFR